ncbi:hypothetical protein BB341_10130 [Streptomyces clavuligerus]|uniref:Gram-positive cocci surface proteins LPxTG domain-containing protein n=2 Tax=Streptomyces clavuligerus TaxID=1901 RepID=E2Q367_STRCL|nr:hypothetical protein BB341_10130 [Streptomyces clavuligerus]EFG08782.1 Hypothetical protein SCLAV_3710 [Streptomyces clavuligerus]
MRIRTPPTPPGEGRARRPGPRHSGPPTRRGLMRIRRTLVIAAATAVISPAALWVAPAASATPPGTSPAPSTAESTPVTGEPGPPKDAGDTRGPRDPKGPAGVTNPQDSTKDGGPKDGPEEKDKDAAGRTPSGPVPSSTPAQPDRKPQDTKERPGTGPLPPIPPGTIGAGSPHGDDETGESCATRIEDSPLLQTELRGLPRKVEAGSGWVEYTFRLTNKADRERTGIRVYTEAWGPEQPVGRDMVIDHQWLDQGTWRNVDVDRSTFGAAGALKPGQSAEAKLRLRVDATKKPGTGSAFSGAGFSEKIDGKLHCESAREGRYAFTVVAPDKEPGGNGGSGTGGSGPGGPTSGGSGSGGSGDGATTGGGAEQPGGGQGQGGAGAGDGRPDPQGGRDETPLGGNLAATGSDRTLPVIAGIGALAVVAGAGTFLAARRRRTSRTA